MKLNVIQKPTLSKRIKVLTSKGKRIATTMGGRIKKQPVENFYREEDKWDYIGYACILLALGLLIFGAML